MAMPNIEYKYMVRIIMESGQMDKGRKGIG